MSERSSVLAVIIGRAGSKGLPGKNALPIAGRPMLCHSIDDARRASMVDRVIVSTDGDTIADAAASMGIDVVRRPPELADDHATVDAAVRHAVGILGAEPEIIVILYANVPVRPDDLIDRAVRLLIDTGADSVQSYADVGKHHPHWMVRLDASGRVQPNVSPMPHRRQDLPELFIPDGGVIVVRRTSLFIVDDADPHAFLGRDRRGLTTPPGAVIDIDDAADLARAEAALLARAPGRTVSAL